MASADTPSPTLSPTPTPPTGTLATLTNNTGVAASDLHFYLIEPAEAVTVQVITEAPGCASPVASAGLIGGGPDFTFGVNIVWSSACVDPGESVTVGLLCLESQFSMPCPGTPLNQCGNWTLAGSIIGPPCPTPDCGGVPCCDHRPCTPTATPPTPTGPPVGGFVDVSTGGDSSGGSLLLVLALLAMGATGAGWFAFRRASMR